jgi:hypothetical protein
VDEYVPFDTPVTYSPPASVLNQSPPKSTRSETLPYRILQDMQEAIQLLLRKVDTLETEVKNLQTSNQELKQTLSLIQKDPTVIEIPVVEPQIAPREVASFRNILLQEVLPSKPKGKEVEKEDIFSKRLSKIQSQKAIVKPTRTSPSSMEATDGILQGNLHPVPRDIPEEYRNINPSDWTTLYFQDVPYAAPLSIKTTLRSLNMNLKRILWISWIGRKTLEIIIHCEAVQSFIELATTEFKWSNRDFQFKRPEFLTRYCII